MSTPFTPKPPTPPLTRPGTASTDKTPFSPLSQKTDSPFNRPAGTGPGATGLGATGAGAATPGAAGGLVGRTPPPSTGRTPLPSTDRTPAPPAGRASTPLAGTSTPFASRGLFSTPAGATTPAPVAARPAAPSATGPSVTGTGLSASAPAAAPGIGMKATDEEFRQLRDFIYEQCGIYIADNRKYLIENRLLNRLKELNLKNFSEYYHYLRYDTNRRAELTRLFEVVTTNETSFFRNPPQLEVFQTKVLPTIIADIKAKGLKKLRIWSAGCSTGDEPYTIAIILHEVLKSEISSWDIKITASDLSEAVLAAGRRGVYNEYTLRTTPKELVDRYFHKEGTNYRVDDKLKAMIQFGALNLNDRMQIKRIDPSHIIFCRNVIIYFDDVMKKNVISSFYDNLLPGGYLIIGHSESLHNISRAFQPEHHPSAIMYRRG